ncbi:MAG: DNA recombination protein RmuC [Anaerolineales bacterium]|nr:DNA recombination protein RmuC [Anaerolineales bacterium]
MDVMQIIIFVILPLAFITVALGVLLFILIKTQVRLNEISKQIPNNQSFETLSQRLQDVDASSRQSFERLAKSLGELSKATEQMMDVGKTISGIEDLLKPPKLRGSLGETLLERLLAQILPPQHYDLQHKFKGGETVDAVIRIGERLVPVDSKFPMDSFRRMITADDEGVSQKERRSFIKAVKQHIDTIAQKYILPDEGTYDFALMYIPAENIYYETIIKDEQGEELYPYATGRRVIPVSPNSFYAYLQVIVFGLKGMRIEERAKAIMGHLVRLTNEEEKFRKEFEVLGTHLKNAGSKYADAERKLLHFEDKLLDVSSVQTAELPAGDIVSEHPNGG